MTIPMNKSTAQKLAEQYNAEFRYFNGEEALYYTWNFNLPDNPARTVASVQFGKEKSDEGWYWLSHIQIQQCTVFNEDSTETLDTIADLIGRAIKFYQFEIVPIIRRLDEEGKT